MATNTLNPYFGGKYTQGTESEQNLLEDMIIESIQINGIEARYIPRQLVDEDDILIEDRWSEYTQLYSLEMYLDNIDQFGGEQDFFSKFGYEARDELTLTVAKKRWETQVRDAVEADPNVTLQISDRPAEGDLVYIPLFEGFFEITFVDPDTVFYQLGNLYVYTLTMQRFTYSYENINVDADEPYETPASGEDPFEQNKTFDDVEDDYVDFSDPNILAGDDK